MLFLGIFLLCLTFCILVTDHRTNTNFGVALGLPYRTPGWFVALKMFAMVGILPLGIYFVVVGA